MIQLALVTLALLVGAAPLPGTTESPTQGACDATGYLVCAGADLGANVGCASDASGLASCSWTYGWLIEGFSPVGLPGNESHVVDATVSVCSSVSGCETTAFHHAGSCAWLPAASCLDSQPGPAGSLSRQLALGECVTVTVDLSGSIDARVVDGVATLATATFSNTGTGAGSACFVDNGR